MGTFQSRLELGSKQTETVESVVKEVNGALLSWYDSTALGILPENYPAQVRPIEAVQRSSCEQITAKQRKHSSSKLPSWPYTHDPTPAHRQGHATAIMEAFPRVFGASSTLREMDGGPMKIQLTADARPFAVTDHA